MTNDDGTRQGSEKVDCGSLPMSNWPCGATFARGVGTLDPHSPAAMAGSSKIIRSKNGRKHDRSRNRGGGQGPRFFE